MIRIWLLLAALVLFALLLRPAVVIDCMTDTECAEFGGNGDPD